MRVLTWNLFHGRSQPPAGRGLLDEFATLLAGWDWDVALLQEVPPWWPARLAHRCGAQQRHALTSRNLGMRVRRALAERRPDLIKSNGGGCNAVLARLSIAEAQSMTLRRVPERRVAQLVRLGDGTCVVNYHGSARVKLAQAELDVLAGRAAAWCKDGPLVLGGDLNLREPSAGPAGLRLVASRDVDHLFVRGLEACAVQRLEQQLQLGGGALQLSDHVPLMADLRRPASGPDRHSDRVRVEDRRAEHEVCA